MSFDEFWDKLEHFPWYYENFDDILKWQNCERQYHLLEVETENRPEFRRAWLDWIGHAYDGKPKPRREDYVV